MTNDRGQATGAQRFPFVALRTNLCFGDHGSERQRGREYEFAAEASAVSLEELVRPGSRQVHAAHRSQDGDKGIRRMCIDGSGIFCCLLFFGPRWRWS